VLAGLVAGYFLWLRDSSLVAVTEVDVRGATVNRDGVSAALERAAAEMTTLHVREDDLEAAVAGYPTVASVSADASFPHGLEIQVTEYRPVAVALVKDRLVPIASDGLVLAGIDADASELPSLEAAGSRGERLDPEGSAQARIIGAAPAGLRERLARAAWDEERGGVVVELDPGPELRFGEPGGVEAKWEAAEAVLGDPGLGFPTYVDVSIPERPVSG
jgi:cell division protein FtsQ